MPTKKLVKSGHSPVDLVTLLTLYYIPDLFGTKPATDAEKASLIKWIRTDMIVQKDRTYHITERGIYFIKHLCRQPIPKAIQIFSIQGEKDE